MEGTSFNGRRCGKDWAGKEDILKEARWAGSVSSLAYRRKGVWMLIPRYTASGTTRHALRELLRIDRVRTAYYGSVDPERAFSRCLRFETDPIHQAGNLAAYSRRIRV